MLCGFVVLIRKIDGAFPLFFVLCVLVVLVLGLCFRCKCKVCIVMVCCVVVVRASDRNSCVVVDRCWGFPPNVGSGKNNGILGGTVRRRGGSAPTHEKRQMTQWRGCVSLRQPVGIWLGK